MTEQLSAPLSPAHRTPLVAIVDDHLLLVETIAAALSGTGIRAVPVAPQDPAGLLAALRAHGPDLVLLDLDLGPYGDASALIGPLTRDGCRVLVVTGITDRMRIARALEQGAVGFQPKAAGFDALLDATRAALSVDGPMDPAATAALLAELSEHRRRRSATLRPFAALTEREGATLRALADGRTVQEIARAWVVSAATVRSHVQAVLRKLGASSQLQAVAAARRSGWLDAGPDRSTGPGEGPA